MAKEWADFYEKELELNGLFYTRPDVKQYESFGGRWVESLGIYNWAFCARLPILISQEKCMTGKTALLLGTWLLVDVGW